MDVEKATEAVEKLKRDASRFEAYSDGWARETPDIDDVKAAFAEFDAEVRRLREQLTSASSDALRALLGATYFWEGHGHRVMAYYHTAINPLYPDDRRTHVQSAIAAYTRAKDLRKDDEVAASLLGDIYRDYARDLPAAIAAYEEAVRRNPSSKVGRMSGEDLEDLKRRLAEAANSPAHTSQASGPASGKKGPNYRNIGGTPGGLSYFLIGALLLLTCSYLILDTVASGVAANYLRLALVPLFVGVAVLFFSAGSPIGWLLAVGGALTIIAHLLSDTALYFRPRAIVSTLGILVSLIAGLGLALWATRPRKNIAP